MKSSKILTRLILLPLGVFATLISCTNESLTPSPDARQQDKNATAMASRRVGIVHHVSAGGPDIDTPNYGPGADANYSLVANMMADGSVKGQYSDRFSQEHGGGGFHATIDCMTIVDNVAWLSGVITSGNSDGTDLTGRRVLTKVVDNGKKDDQISFSYYTNTPCSAKPSSMALFPTRGQVMVW